MDARSCDGAISCASRFRWRPACSWHSARRRRAARRRPRSISCRRSRKPRREVVRHSRAGRHADRQGQRDDDHALAGQGLRVLARVSAPEHGASVVRQGRPSSSAPSTIRVSSPTATTSRTAAAPREAWTGSPFERTGTMWWPTWISSLRKTTTKRRGRRRSSPSERADPSLASPSPMPCPAIASTDVTFSRSRRSPLRRSWR